MKIKFLTITLFCFLLFSCGEENSDCVKTITIPQIYYVNNQPHTIDSTQEVPCDFPDSIDLEIINPPKLENFSYHVIEFSHIVDTNANSVKLKIEVELINPNNANATGFANFTIQTDHTEFSTNYKGYATESCNLLEANSSCVYKLEIEHSLDLGYLKNPVLKDIEYFLTE
tara:strand:+ start:8179 stop:8691 length:513 start_codon:yes stop_codon:yes gene_type:complete